MRHRTLASLTAPAVLALALAACATGAGAAPSGMADPPLIGASTVPDGEVVGQGTVIDVAGAAQLCLGGVMESYPPQCAGGLPLVGWSWEDLDGAESSGDTTWGAYAVQGTYDGAALTVTSQPILLALYDPIAPEDPTGGVAGVTDEATLLEVQAELPEVLGVDVLTSAPEDGYLRALVVWDDGGLQAAADEAFGDDVVIVTSALREIDG